MAKRYNFNKNQNGEITVFDTIKQKSVGGTLKTKSGWFTFFLSGNKPKVTNLTSTTKAVAEKRLNKLFK